ncbi:pirin family protein [Vogesella sp. XCS3]|uniref:pirin family protein n=1 Tax=Vogesella sp. XCS3 TaxID=2877939 RepID=UPI001D09C5B3|nr:pirin family protein [Vogesella sp. XCS3]UDM17738.1 pirin family protein [Vogesella sp. XCS3]
MLIKRPAAERGHAHHGWLESYHSFSFAGYHDPAHMGWGNLRVINDDRVAAGEGFGRHPHRDMEIISYVLAGALAHEDSLGNRSTILPGEVQRMSAGTGVLHSEFNHERSATTHFLQIWLYPHTSGMAPGYEQKAVPPASKRGQLCLIASPEGGEHTVQVHADARLYAGLFDGQEQATLALDPQRKAYVHLISGSLQVNGEQLAGGDALKVAEESQLHFSQGQQAEVLVFDLGN